MTKETNPIEWLVNAINQDCLNSTFVRPELKLQALAMFNDAVNDAHLKGFQEATEEYKKLFHFTIKTEQHDA